MSGTLNKYNHASLQNVLFYIVLTEYITNNHKLNMTGFFEIYVGGGGCCCGVPTANTYPERDDAFSLPTKILGFIPRPRGRFFALVLCLSSLPGPGPPHSFDLTTAVIV